MLREESKGPIAGVIPSVAIPISDMLLHGYLEEGELLRYKNRSNELLMVGCARESGVDFAGRESVSYTGSEDLAGSSKHHWPSDHILTQDGRSLEHIYWEYMKNKSAKNLGMGEIVTASKTNLISQQNPEQKCSICENQHPADEGHLDRCKHCLAYFHVQCADKYMDCRRRAPSSCPACVCLVCGEGHFEVQACSKPNPLFVDPIPMGCPKNTCTVELPTKNYVDMDWVRAIMATRPLVSNVILKNKGCTQAIPRVSDGLPSKQMRASGTRILKDNLELVKNCSTWQDVSSALNARFASQPKSLGVCDELRTLALALVPNEQFKETDGLLERVSRGLFCLLRENQSSYSPIELKRAYAPGPSWWSISSKRQKLDSGINSVYNSREGYQMHYSRTGFGFHCNATKSQQVGVQAPSDWYMLKGTNGRQGYWHRKVKTTRTVPQLKPSNGYSAQSLPLQTRDHGSFEIGFPFQCDKKWRPRGFLPKFSTSHEPSLRLEDALPKQDLAQTSGVQKMDLSVTGTNGHGIPGLKRMGEQTLWKIAFQILNPDILTKFRFVRNQHGSKESTESSKEEVDVPRLDLTAPITMVTMESEQVPSSASDCSMDFEGMSRNEAAFDSNFFRRVPNGAKSEEISCHQEACNAVSDAVNSSACNRSTCQPTPRINSTVGQGSAGHHSPIQCSRSCSGEKTVLSTPQNSVCAPGNPVSTPGCSDSVTITDNDGDAHLQNLVDSADVNQSSSIRRVSDKVEVCCGHCKRRCHKGCLGNMHSQALVPWFCSKSCHNANRLLADLNCRGLMQIDRLIDNTPISWQLVRGGALEDNQKCQGYVPKYTSSQKVQLLKMMQALVDSIHPMHRISGTLATAYLYGKYSTSSREDLSNFHVGILWIGATLVGFCLVRALGSLSVEMPYLEIRKEFRGHRLSKHLLGSLELSLLRMGVQYIFMPATLTRTNDLSAETYCWPMKMGYKVFNPLEFPDFHTLGPANTQGVPKLIKNCTMGAVVRLKMYCEKSPVSHELLVEEMLELQKNKLKKSHSLARHELVPSFPENGTRKTNADGLIVTSQGLVEVDDRALIGRTRSNRAIRTSLTRFEGAQKAVPICMLTPDREKAVDSVDCNQI